MENLENFNKEKKIFKTSSDEIDLRNFFNCIVRRKFLILSISVLGIFGSYFHARQKVPIYKGSFEIVLNQKKNINSILNSASSLIGGINPPQGLQTNTRNIETEVSIIKSSSVLKPVYNFIINKKYNNDFSKLTYRNWVKSSLEVNLTGRTTVLEINYFDSQKDLIKPVLDQISTIYQKYSGRDRQNGLKKDLIYIDAQAEILRSKWRDSLFKFQEFAEKNSIGNRDGLPIPLSAQQSQIFDQSINLSQDIGNDIPKRYQSNYEKLIQLEDLYTEKAIFLKPNSQYLKNLKLRISKIEESLSQPKEVVLKFKELRRDAIRNEQLLRQLENKSLETKFEIGQEKYPWELISDTIIFQNPVSPDIPKIILLGFSASFLFSILLALIMDNLTGLVYSKDTFGKVFEFPLLMELPSEKNLVWDESINLLFNYLSDNKKYKGLNLFLISSNDSEVEINFCDYVKDKFLDFKIALANDISKLDNKYKTVVICSDANIKKNKLYYLNQQLKFISFPPIGWIYLDNFFKI